MTNKLLTVTIPTYNRPEHIQRQVRDLLKQKTDQVDIVVRDNCSEIPVESLFSDEEKSQIKIYRNSVNIGGEANQARCIEDVPSGWAWTLGDDDRISDNAIQTILSLINDNKDCCYINMCTKKDLKSNNYIDFLNYFKIIGAFGVAFFQSANLFNIDKIRPYIHYFYDYMTSQVGQIIIIFKYLEDNPDEKCMFSTKRVIIDNPPGGWEKANFLINFPIVIDKFYDHRAIMKSNLFKGLGDMYFTILSQESFSFSNHIHYIRYISSKLGFINILRYNKLTFAEYILSKILPSKLYISIRNRYASSYNKNLNSIN